jgi:hypothetical protein
MLHAGAADSVQHLLGPIGTLMVWCLADGEVTWKVTHAGAVTMMPPT